MTAITRNPTNPNMLQPNKFTLNFSRLPNVQYFCQGVSIPGIALSEAPQPTPFIDLYVPGEKAVYDILNVTFYVDEEITAWKEVHDWIRAMTFPVDFEEYKQLGRLSKNIGNSKTPQYSDAILTLYSSSNNPLYRFKLKDCFPTTLSAFVMSSTDSPDTIITADASFRFAYYDIEKLF